MMNTPAAGQMRLVIVGGTGHGFFSVPSRCRVARGKKRPMVSLAQRHGSTVRIGKRVESFGRGFANLGSILGSPGMSVMPHLIAGFAAGAAVVTLVEGGGVG